MRTRPTIIFFSPAARPLPALVSAWIAGKGFPAVAVGDPAQIEAMALRSLPALVLVDADGAAETGRALCERLKADPYTAIVPVAFLADRHSSAGVHEAFRSGADEVLTPIFEPDEQRSRLDVLLTRTERNVSVHPSTRLPGTNEIEREIKRYMDAGGLFAVCYADLDHFKEFNDRYSYYDGDRVIFLLSRILHDVVRGLCGPNGFVGHIGGDDFILVLPLESAAPCCSEIITVFDLLIPFQYSDQDRRAGYFFGKDRRGTLHRVPFMTLSIGIVTNERRRFSHPAQVSELATEMKSYAKTLPGSVFVFDRRHDPEPGEGR
ncbi:MAG TPA: diguanylate cyclase [Gemmatimonadales bacterium]|nr:diguanylate cyclase [Gemmatimonadales bacterium]